MPISWRGSELWRVQELEGANVTSEEQKIILQGRKIVFPRQNSHWSSLQTPLQACMHTRNTTSHAQTHHSNSGLHIASSMFMMTQGVISIDTGDWTSNTGYPWRGNHRIGKRAKKWNLVKISNPTVSIMDSFSDNRFLLYLYKRWISQVSVKNIDIGASRKSGHIIFEHLHSFPKIEQ